MAPAPAPGAFHIANRPRKNRLAAQKPVEFIRHFRGGLVAVPRPLIETFKADGLEIGRDGGVERTGARRLLFDRFVDQHFHSAAKGQRVGQQFEQQDAERIDVAAAVGERRVASRLLGRNVRRRAENPAIRRHRDLPDRPHGQTEVRDVRFATLVHQDVLRFEIAVDYARLVREIQRPADLRA